MHERHKGFRRKRTPKEIEQEIIDAIPVQGISIVELGNKIQIKRQLLLLILDGMQLHGSIYLSNARCRLTYFGRKIRSKE